MPFEFDSAAFTLANDGPLQLAEFYIEPHCQQFNPADDDEDEARYVVHLGPQ